MLLSLGAINHRRLLLLTSDKSGATVLLDFYRKHVMKEPTPSDVLRGTLDLLVLKTLTLEPMHGWGISQRIQQMSKNVLDVNQGSLYPALQRLELKEWIDSEWRASDNNRRAKYYRLTAKGRRALGAETDSWRRYVVAVEDILATQS